MLRYIQYTLEHWPLACPSIRPACPSMPALDTGHKVDHAVPLVYPIVKKRRVVAFFIASGTPVVGLPNLNRGPNNCWGTAAGPPSSGPNSGDEERALGRLRWRIEGSSGGPMIR